MSKITSSFIQGLKQNPDMLKRITVTQDLLDGLLTELSSRKRGFVVATPTNVPSVPSSVVSYYIDNHYVDKPVCIRQIGDEYWVGSRYTRIARFSSSWAFLGWLGRYGNPFDSNDPGLYMYTISFAVDQTRDRIAICMEWRHCVKVFRLSTWEHLWTFGDNVAGHVWDNRLWNPKDVEWMSDGNLIVTGYNGYGMLEDGTKGTRHGHVSILDGNTGAFIKSVLIGKTEGWPWLQEVYHPCRARIFGTKCYVSYYYGDCVASFDLENNWKHDQAYFKPTGIEASKLYPRGFFVDIDNSKIIISLQGPKAVGVLNTETHALLGITGFGKWEDSPNVKGTPGALWDVWDVVPYNNGYVVADEGNNRLTFVPADCHYEVPITLDGDIPTNSRVYTELLPWQLDLENKVIKVPVKYLPMVKPFIIPYEEY